MVGSAQAGPCGVLRQSNLPFVDRNTLRASETLTGRSTQTEGEDMASCPRVCFGAAEGEGESRRPWKVTVRYDRKELQRRLQLEQWLEDAVAALHYDYLPALSLSHSLLQKEMPCLQNNQKADHVVAGRSWQPTPPTPHPQERFQHRLGSELAIDEQRCEH
uniref:Protein phosphatase 1 regulatory subunit 14D n=1 Tax=Eptatretus burgeri TaxID=7764 RepID=A0A8C4X094_EPTBU